MAQVTQNQTPIIIKTYKLNQTDHFDVAPILKSIESNFSDKFSEENKVTLQSYIQCFKVTEFKVSHVLN